MSIKLFSNQLYYNTSSFGFLFFPCMLLMMKDNGGNE